MTNVNEHGLIVSEAKQVVAGMSVVLRQAYEQIRERLTKATVNDILSRYDVGKIIDTVMKNESKYGADAAQTLSAALDITVASLYQCRQVAVTWDRKELSQLLGRSSELSGYYLTWAHVWALSTVTEDGLRTELMERAYDEMLSARDIRAIITSALGVRTNNPRGRPRAAPKTPAAGLATLRKLTHSLVNAQSVFEESVFDRLVESPADYASESIIEQLREAKEDQLRLETTAKNNRLKLQAALEAVEREFQSGTGKLKVAKSTTVGDEFLPQPRQRQPKADKTEKGVAKRAADVLARLRARGSQMAG